MSRSQGQRIQVPDDLREALLEFTISYLLEQPGDVVSYAADYFGRLKDTRATAIIHDAGGTSATVLTSPDESPISREEGGGGGDECTCMTEPVVCVCPDE